MAFVREIIDLVVCWKIHGCGCVADNPAPQRSERLAVTKDSSICASAAYEVCETPYMCLTIKLEPWSYLGTIFNKHTMLVLFASPKALPTSLAVTQY